MYQNIKPDSKPLPNEEWRRCHYPYIRYEVSNYGRVRHARRKELIHFYLQKSPSQSKGWKPYKMVSIRVKNKVHKPLVHRLVAFAFIPLPDDSLFVKYEVDHIDGDKMNNRVENLRWVTSSENMKAYWALKRQKEQQHG
ncbi:MAG: HNH endonuclease [Prevotella sp.]|nr:HNH endonuclease [Prevotella sp.]